jgi:D-tagatose-1,6-bisphosphate aldolase subunit GatZ/KbaZ
LVVQPGVEFGHENVVYYDPQQAEALSAWRSEAGSIVFEAHSTDYQPEDCLRALVRDGFAILKVGPGLTFALREALYALDRVASELVPDYPDNHLRTAMDQVMRANPQHWRAYYSGSDLEQYLLRHYSYSDRIRYYWSDATAQAAVERLLAALANVSIGETLISQYLPDLYPRVVTGEIAAQPHDLLIAAVRKPLQAYAKACAPSG